MFVRNFFIPRHFSADLSDRIIMLQAKDRLNKNWFLAFPVRAPPPLKIGTADFQAGLMPSPWQECEDGTGMNNWQKWIAGLNPTNPASVLAVQIPVVTNAPTGITVSWQSVNSRTYYLQRATNLASQPPFTFIQSNLVGQSGSTSFTDTTATNGGAYFYRVGVQ
jgi:hypothetical protein